VSSAGPALRKFEQQVGSDPDSAEKFYWLGAGYLLATSAEKNPAYLDKAIACFEKALQIDPRHQNAHAKLFGAYLSKGDHPALRRTAMRWAQVDPNLPAEARQWLRDQEAATTVPGTADEAVAEGQELNAAGKFDEAINLLEKARSAYPGHARSAELLAEILSDRGAARYQMGQPESAFQDFLRATQADPRNWRALVNLSSAAKQRGDSDLAREAGRKALALHPELRSNAQFMKQMSALGVAVAQGTTDTQVAQPARGSSAEPARASATTPAKRKKWWQVWK
jgi:tetratricopeptide (TPR) repeat protein